MSEREDVRFLQGDCREVLRTLEPESVHCAITSPPYWGLRAYGTEPQVWGGAEDCEHEWLSERYYREGGGNGSSSEAFSEPGPANAARLKETRWRESTECVRCCAWRGELGLEPTPRLYVAHLVEVFRDVRRVLRPEGTLWLNLGDCYAGSWGNYAPGGIKSKQRPQTADGQRWERPAYEDTFRKPPGANKLNGIKPKDLIGVPWMTAFALRDDGWYLRQAITWCKPAPMPESVKDRCTTATEMLFMFSMRPHYYYDQDAIREPHTTADRFEGREPNFAPHQHIPNGSSFGNNNRSAGDGVGFHPKGRNRRNWWVINTQSIPDAHYAPMPEKLAELAILAGCPEGGTVLDPFGGSGTVGLAATKLGRRAVLIDLKPDYIDLQKKRNAQISLLL